MRLAYRILRNYRGYVLPGHRRAYEDVVRAGAMQPGDEKRRFAFFDFTNSEIDWDAGRYIFALVREFELNGLIACYRNHFPLLSNMRYKRYKSLLLNAPFRVVNGIADLPKGSIAAIVTDRKRIQAPHTKLIRISYDRRLPATPTEMVMPFKPYPKLYHRLDSLKEVDMDRRRPWRVFFAGTVNKRYARSTLRKQFGKMSRVETLETVRKQLRTEEFHELDSLAEIVRGHRFIITSKALRVAPERWFDVLAKSEFFLACPGGAMPICHNVVEAVAVGSIPILEYPEYLDPVLQPGVNCLTFTGKANLLETMRRALEMDHAHIAELRKGAVAYYREHLAPGTFGREILASKRSETTVLFNAPLVSRLKR